VSLLIVQASLLTVLHSVYNTEVYLVGLLVVTATAAVIASTFLCKYTVEMNYCCCYYCYTMSSRTLPPSYSF
jgi:hypothetical protein